MPVIRILYVSEGNHSYLSKILFYVKSIFFFNVRLRILLVLPMNSVFVLVVKFLI